MDLLPSCPTNWKNPPARARRPRTGAHRQNNRLALLQVLEDRYGLSSVVIASQLPIDAWYGYIDEPILAETILEWLRNNAHRFELKGESLRKKSSPKPK